MRVPSCRNIKGRRGILILLHVIVVMTVDLASPQSRDGTEYAGVLPDQAQGNNVTPNGIATLMCAREEMQSMFSV